MHYDLNQVDRHHQVNINESAPVSLIAKRCACGTAAPAKQLVQHGKCTACMLAYRVATLQPEDLEILRHMLGATPHHPVARWGFRNEYLVNHWDRPSITRLVAAGFVRLGGSLLHMHYFCATAAGCKVAGLSAKRTDVAMAAVLGARP